MACGLERGPHAVCMVCAVSSGQAWPREAKLTQRGGVAKGRRAVSRGWPGRAGFVEAVRWGASFPCRSFHSPSLSDHELLPKARCPGGSGQGR